LFFWIECSLALLCLLLAILISNKSWPWLEKIEHAFCRLAEKRIASVILIGFLALTARLALLPLMAVPHPSINDEFSFLLASDTFAHGRATNPPHPMWVHFENLHELQHPTYASMYPPAQGVFLAAGQRVTGHPFAGVCLVVALFCAATCWMLQGWASPALALMGGLFAIVRFGMFSYWANSYWGGATAALGGALVLGALPRMRQLQDPKAALTLGVGLAILANSRPYEGLLLAIPVAVWLLIWLLQKKDAELRQAALRVALPLFLVLLLTAAAMGYYFWRVTGNPFLMPQVLERNTYAVAPYFLWKSPRPVPAYDHPFLRDFYVGTELSFYESNRSLTAIAALTIVKIFNTWLFYLGPLLTLPLAISFFANSRKLSWRSINADTRFLLAVVACSLFGLSFETFFFPHYAAPMACVLLALSMRALGNVRQLKERAGPAGLFLSRSVPVVCLILLALRCASAPLHFSVTSDWPPTWYNAIPAVPNRAKVLAQLKHTPGMHLVLVQYGKTSRSRNQWVYNDADVDASQVVWAWDMGAARNRELLDYFKDRRVWSIDPDHETSDIAPYHVVGSF
jgi:hypothetical protein